MASVSLFKPRKTYRDQHCIIIGAMKCGTTALFRFLSEHYASIGASRQKDTRFFVASAHGGNWDKELSWYVEMFPYDASIKLEASTHYTKYPDYPGCPARIRLALDHVTLVYLVRDPLRRAISHYFHNVFVDRERLDINIALCGDLNKYLYYSDYALQLTRYHRHFDIEDIIILNVIDRDQRAHALRELERRLGLPHIADSVPFKPANTTRENAENSSPDGSSTADDANFPDDNVRAALDTGLTRDNLARMIDRCVDSAARFEALTGVATERWVRSYHGYL